MKRSKLGENYIKKMDNIFRINDSNMGMTFLTSDIPISNRRVSVTLNWSNFFHLHNFAILKKHRSILLFIFFMPLKIITLWIKTSRTNQYSTSFFCVLFFLSPYRLLNHFCVLSSNVGS